MQSDARPGVRTRGRPSTCATSRRPTRVDASRGTTPVWQPLANLDQAKSNYGAIVYNKAPAVLKQLELPRGRHGVPRRACSATSRAHAYGNATWRDLLAAVGAGRRPRPRRVGRAVHPAARDARARGHARRRRRDDPRSVRRSRCRARARGRSARSCWCAATARRRCAARSTLDAATTRVAVAADPDALRLPQRGRPRVRAGAARPGQRARGWSATSASATTSATRCCARMLWGALWDLVREARYAPTRFLALAERALPAEQRRAARRVRSSDGRRASPRAGSAPPNATPRCPARGAARARAADDAARPYGIRKAHLDALIAAAQSPAALAALDARLDSATAAGAPLRAPTRWAIVTRARRARRAHRRRAAGRRDAPRLDQRGEAPRVRRGRRARRQRDEGARTSRATSPTAP